MSGSPPHRGTSRPVRRRWSCGHRPPLDRTRTGMGHRRTLEANAATASLIGLTLGATVDRKWFIFPAVVAGFLLQHAVQGWCPPLPIFRRLGFRTQPEIDYERYALKSLRGDFLAIWTLPNATTGRAEGKRSRRCGDKPEGGEYVLGLALADRSRCRLLATLAGHSAPAGRADLNDQ